MAYGDRMFEDQDDSSWKVSKLFLSPGEIVKSFNVDILLSQVILTSDWLTQNNAYLWLVKEVEVLDCEVVASVLGDITNETVLQRDYSSTDNLENLVSFNMNTLEQALVYILTQNEQKKLRKKTLKIYVRIFTGGIRLIILEAVDSMELWSWDFRLMKLIWRG